MQFVQPHLPGLINELCKGQEVIAVHTRYSYESLLEMQTVPFLAQTFVLDPAREKGFFSGEVSCSLRFVLLICWVRVVTSTVGLERRSKAWPFIYFCSFSLRLNEDKAVCLETCANFLSYAVCGTQELPMKAFKLLDLSE